MIEFALGIAIYLALRGVYSLGHKAGLSANLRGSETTMIRYTRENIRLGRVINRQGKKIQKLKRRLRRLKAEVAEELTADRLLDWKFEDTI